MKTAVIISKADYIILGLYVLICIMPRLGAIDVMGSQWFFLSLLNCLTSIYLLVIKKNSIQIFFNSNFFRIYLAFLFVALLSFLASLNVIESCVTYSRLITGFIAFINITLIILKNSKVLDFVFMLLGALTVIQIVVVPAALIINYADAPTLDILLKTIHGNSGHKNILAASIVMGIPFLIYQFHSRGFVLKLFIWLVIFTGFAGVFVLNARSSYLGLFTALMIYFILCTLNYFKNKKEPKKWIQPGLIMLAFIFSFILSQSLLSQVEKEKKHIHAADITARIENTSFTEYGSSGRTRMWKNTVDYILHHPILGGGYGNWKINLIPYDNKTWMGFGFSSKHAHNDFLEITADTGIAGGILFYSVFCCLFIYSIKLITSSEVSFNVTMITSSAMISLVVYCIDSMFNFPLDRPIMQLWLAFIMAILFSLYLKNKKQDNTNFYFKIFPYGLILFLTLITVYINYEVFKSMQLQYKIEGVWSDKIRNQLILPSSVDETYNSATVNPLFPWIPDINEFGMPVSCIKAKFLMDEGKYSEALYYLNKDKNANPYIYYNQFLRSLIDTKLKAYDIAYYLAKIAFYNRPVNMYLYHYYNSLAFMKRDSTEMKNSFNMISHYNHPPEIWSDFSDNITTVTGNPAEGLDVIENGLIKFPKDTLLLFKKDYYEGLSNFNHHNYQKSIYCFTDALNFHPDASVSIYIGLSYMNLNLFSNAIPYFSAAITFHLFKDGKPEFYRGVCYKQIGKTDSACMDFMKVKSLGMGIDPALLSDCN